MQNEADKSRGEMIDTQRLLRQIAARNEHKASACRAMRLIIDAALVLLAIIVLCMCVGRYPEINRIQAAALERGAE